MSDKLDLEAIEARYEAASPKPWHVRGSSIFVEKRMYDESLLEELSVADLEFCAHARTDVPLLVAEVEQLRAEREKFFTDLVQCLKETTSAEW